MILIDLSPLLNTHIQNIHLEFKNLLNNLKDKLIKDSSDIEKERLKGTAKIFFRFSK